MTTTKVTALKTLTASAVLCALAGTANAATIGNTDVSYGGYVKLDAMWSLQGISTALQQPCRCI